MSFCSRVKDELCEIKCEKPCCRIAGCCAAVLFSRTLTSDSVCFQTEHRPTAERLRKALHKCFGINTDILSGKNSALFTVKSDDAGDCAAIIEKCTDGGRRRIPDTAVRNDCCAVEFLRSAFLAGGTLTDPNKEYRLEFFCPDEALANSLFSLLVSLGFHPKLSRRETKFVVYFKDSGEIEDLLTMMGAGSSTLELMEIKVLKDVRNRINRKTNFETANYIKTLDAGAVQCEAILKLKLNGLFDKLPDELKSTAEIRLENPEVSLGELSKISGMSRSGLNHRLQKLVHLAEEN
jgi:DNA-binding protein WhiA